MIVCFRGSTRRPDAYRPGPCWQPAVGALVDTTKIVELSKVQSVDQRMRLERGVGFRQLRTCRRRRPGQLWATCGHMQRSIIRSDQTRRASPSTGQPCRLPFLSHDPFQGFAETSPLAPQENWRPPRRITLTVHSAQTRRLRGRLLCSDQALDFELQPAVAASVAFVSNESACRHRYPSRQPTHL